MKFYDSWAKTDVTLTSFDTEKMEAAGRTILEAASWLDRWLTAALSMISAKLPVVECYCLFMTVAKMVMRISKTALGECCSDEEDHCALVTYEHKSGMGNTPIVCSF